MVQGSPTPKSLTHDAFASFWVWGPATGVALIFALLSLFDNAPTRWLEGRYGWGWARVIIAGLAFIVIYCVAAAIYIRACRSPAVVDPPESAELVAANNPTTTDEAMADKLRESLTSDSLAIRKATRDLVREYEYEDIVQCHYHVAVVRGLRSMIVSTLKDFKTMLATAAQHWVEPIRNFGRVLLILAQVEKDLMKARRKHMKNAFMAAGGQLTAALDVIEEVRQQIKDILGNNTR